MNIYCRKSLDKRDFPGRFAVGKWWWLRDKSRRGASYAMRGTMAS